jgi:hypothetical protein
MDIAASAPRPKTLQMGQAGLWVFKIWRDIAPRKEKHV